MRTSLPHAKQLALTALFAALCLIGTLLIAIPLPVGYFNVGDVFVLLAGWMLGPVYGSIAAGVGSAMADLFSGYGVYAPFTLVIKSLMACVAYFAWLFLTKSIRKPSFTALIRLPSAILTEIVMVVGYFLTETLFYGFPTAVGTLLGNSLQGGCCLLLATAILSILHPLKQIHQLFPHLKKSS